MAIRFLCSRCGVAIKAPAQRAGAELPCPKCGKKLTVPTGGDEQAEAAQFAELISSLGDSDPPPATEPPTSRPPTSTAPEAKPKFPVTAEPPASVSYESVGKGQVRIVDIRLPFASVFRLGLQLWAVGFLAAIVIWLVMAMVAIVLSAIGISLF